MLVSECILYVFPPVFSYRVARRNDWLDFAFGRAKAKAKNFEGVVKASSDLLWVVVALIVISPWGRGSRSLTTRR